MPLFAAELNRQADEAVAEDLRIWLHTGAPTDANHKLNRVVNGGGAYAAGLPVPASDWSDAANGDVSNNNALNFGQAQTANPGDLTHYSLTRGTGNGEVGVGYGTLTNVTIAINDTYEIPAGAVQLNSATT